jgi:hypothetical protein
MENNYYLITGFNKNSLGLFFLYSEKDLYAYHGEKNLVDYKTKLNGKQFNDYIVSLDRGENFDLINIFNVTTDQFNRFLNMNFNVLKEKSKYGILDEYLNIYEHYI